MPDAKTYVGGSDYLALGADSYTSPLKLPDQKYVAGMNVTNRGGLVQTRPGTVTKLCAGDGNIQGLTLFTPKGGVAHLVFAVDGFIYVSPAPFDDFVRLPNIRFSKTAVNIAWATTLKSTDYTPAGVLYYVDNPRSVLVMEDGLTRAAYWDGATSGHLDPSCSTDTTDSTDTTESSTVGCYGTPVGLWMVWSGNRLWVSRGNQVFASDIGNPLKFTETLYLNEGRAFYLSGPCTGMIETPDQQGILVFTETDVTFIQSSIQDRTMWLSTPAFQKVVIPNIGCVAPRSIVNQYGLTWWFSPRGLTNINAALRQNISSRLDLQDNQMFSSKAYLGPNLSGVCSGFYENYLLVSVPAMDVLNRHTWALDQAPVNDSMVNAWASYWTGWRPVEWTKGVVNGSERIFFASRDYDGNNRIWEAFKEEKTDNGCAITCWMQTKDHAFDSMEPKRFNYGRYFLREMLGTVDLSVYVAATKGGYQLLQTRRMNATAGQIYGDTQYNDSVLFAGNRGQTRSGLTPSPNEESSCNECGVESQVPNLQDYAFSLLFIWSGQMGISTYQLFAIEEPRRDDGACEEDESADEPRSLNAAGCSALSFLVSTSPFSTYTGEATAEATTPAGTEISVTVEVESQVSQENADLVAACQAQQNVNKTYQELTNNDE